MFTADCVLIDTTTYTNAIIYRYGEPGGKYVPDLFDEYQVCIKNNTSEVITHIRSVHLLRLRKQRPVSYMKRYRRMVVTYDHTSFGPIFVVPHDKYEELDIPLLFHCSYKDIEHFAFVANDWLYLTKDELIMSIEL